MILEGSYVPTPGRACLADTWREISSSYRQVQSQQEPRSSRIRHSGEESPGTAQSLSVRLEPQGTR